jgi:hypothetical protein
MEGPSNKVDGVTVNLGSKSKAGWMLRRREIMGVVSEVGLHSK